MGEAIDAYERMRLINPVERVDDWPAVNALGGVERELR